MVLTLCSRIRMQQIGRTVFGLVFVADYESALNAAIKNCQQDVVAMLLAAD